MQNNPGPLRASLPCTFDCSFKISVRHILNPIGTAVQCGRGLYWSLYLVYSHRCDHLQIRVWVNADSRKYSWDNLRISDPHLIWLWVMGFCRMLTVYTMMMMNHSATSQPSTNRPVSIRRNRWVFQFSKKYSGTLRSEIMNQTRITRISGIWQSKSVLSFINLHPTLEHSLTGWPVLFEFYLSGCSSRSSCRHKTNLLACLYLDHPKSCRMVRTIQRIGHQKKYRLWGSFLIPGLIFYPSWYKNMKCGRARGCLECQRFGLPNR